MKTRFKDSHFVLQHDQGDCGIACLASAIRYYGGEVDLELLRRLCGTTRTGTSLLGLLQGAEQLGLNAEAFEANEVDDLIKLNELSILHVINDLNYQHFIVFFPLLENEIPKKAIKIGDPSKGIAFISIEELDKMWKSRALLKLAPGKHFASHKTASNERKKWILNLIGDDISILIISLFIGIIVAILSFSSAIFSQKLVDDILPGKNEIKLWLGVFLLLVLLLCRVLLVYFRGVLIFKQGRGFNWRIIQNFYENILNLPKSFFDSRKIGDLVARMNDARRIQSVLTLVTGAVVIDLLTVIGSIAFTTSYSLLEVFLKLQVFSLQ